MPLKKGSPKKGKSKQLGAVIPSMKDHKRPLRPASTEYSPKGIRVTAEVSSGKRNRSK